MSGRLPGDRAAAPETHADFVARMQRGADETPAADCLAEAVTVERMADDREQRLAIELQLGWAWPTENQVSIREQIAYWRRQGQACRKQAETGVAHCICRAVPIADCPDGTRAIWVQPRP